jgi:carbon monoxide dehydrogenase subunit G
MELEHSFIVPVSKGRAWDVLLDVERVAPCMPGATLDSVDGDQIRGKIKVKVGPISMTYAGTAQIVERDEKAGIVRLDASGKETRGAGTASASVRSLLEDRGEETRVTVLTTLNVTGKPAQFGRGVMNEVGGKLLTIFASNLAAMLGQADEAPGEAAPKAEVTLEDLNLPPRALSSLRKVGITTVGELASKTDSEVLAIDGIGRASVDEIKAKLAGHGLALSEPAAAPAAAAASQAPAAAATAGAHSAAANGVAGHSKAGANGARTDATAAAPPRRTSDSAPVHQDEALNLLRVAGVPVLKRSLPVLAGVTAVLIISWRRRVRHRRSR